MSVIVELPDGTQIEAHNAAQESSLRDIVSLLSKSTGQKIDTSSVKAVGQNSKVAARSLIGLSGSLDHTKKSSEGLSKGFQRASRDFKVATRSIFASFSKVGSAGSSFSDSIQSLGTAAAAMAQKIPILGGVAAFGISAFAAILTETAGNFQKMQQSGASFGYSMLETRDIANLAGLSLGMLANVVSKAAKDLAMFGGTTSAGGRIFAKLNREIQTGKLGADLLRMGIGFEEQSEMLAEVMADFVRAGVDVRNLGKNSEIVTRTLATLAIQQKKLAQFNGITLAQQREQMKMQKSNAQLQVSIMGLDVNHRKAAEGFAAQLKGIGPIAEQAFMEVMAHGGAVNDATGIFLSQFPAMAEAMKRWRAGILGGTIGMKDVADEWNALAKSESLKNSLASAADLVKAAMAANIPGAQGIAAAWVKIRDLVEKGGIEVGAAISADAKKLGELPDATTDLMLSSVHLARQLQMAFSTLATVALKSDVMESIQSGISTFNRQVSALANVFATHGQGQEKATLSKALKTLAEEGNSLADILVGLSTTFSTLAKTLSALAAMVSSTSPSSSVPEGKQHGGPVKANMPYIVGENRKPELFVPRTDGYVVPNPALMFQKSKQTANIRNKNQLGTPISAIEKMIEQAKKEVGLEDREEPGKATPPSLGTRKTQVELSRAVESAILALPNLMVANTAAINNATAEHADGLYDLQGALA